jgi:hypothetical protein
MPGRLGRSGMSWLSDKMRKWEESVDRHAGCGRGCRVTEGWQGLTDDPSILAGWSEEAQQRLEAEVPDEAVRRRIMLERSCVFVEEFGDEDIGKLQRLFSETGSLERVVEAMRQSGDRFGDPVVDGRTIVEVRKPRDPVAFARARNAGERQAAACFCPLVRETGSRISLDYCYCSAGWYRGIYEGIFGSPVEVTVEESLLNGDDRCRFTIRIDPR